MPELRNWFCQNNGKQVSVRRAEPNISGEVYGHDHFPDGSVLTIATIGRFDPDTRNLRTVTGHDYALGNAAPEYLDRFPVAEETLSRYHS